MKRNKLAIALVILIGAMAPEAASADRGDRGFDRFQQRHDIFKRHDGIGGRGSVWRDRDLGFRSRGGEFRHRSDVFRPRGDFVKRGGPAFRHDYRAVPVRRGHRHHSHTRLGLFVGVPLYWNWPPPYYAYPPPVVTVPAPPTVYIERGYDEPAPAAGYWYYCDRPDGYYPYVRECPGGWQRVAPTPSR